jgi:hypothetical protein
MKNHLAITSDYCKNIKMIVLSSLSGTLIKNSYLVTSNKAVQFLKINDELPKFDSSSSGKPT